MSLQDRLDPTLNTALGDNVKARFLKVIPTSGDLSKPQYQGEKYGELAVVESIGMVVFWAGGAGWQPVGYTGIEIHNNDYHDPDYLSLADHLAIGDGSPHHAALTIGVDGAHSLAGQVLSAVLAAAAQVGHVGIAAQTFGGLKTFADGIATDTIVEKTLNNGVAIDGSLTKDGLWYPSPGTNPNMKVGKIGSAFYFSFDGNNYIIFFSAVPKWSMAVGGNVILELTATTIDALNHKILNLAAATVNGDAMRYEQVVGLIAALGDTLYGSGAAALAKLAGNITTTKKFLTQTGSGAASAAPSWETIAAGDVPAVKLDDAAAPDDNTDLDVSTTKHGLAPKAVAPAAGLLNVYGIANGETAITNKTIYSHHHYGFCPDAAPGVDVTTGDQQGQIHHSGPGGDTATRLYVDCETAAGTSVVVTVQYGDTDDLDTVASWTTIATVTSSGKTSIQDSMTNAAIPANRLLRMNVGTISGTAPKDVSVTLRAKRPITT